jgi:hypothetical protein
MVVMSVLWFFSVGLVSLDGLGRACSSLVVSQWCESKL